MSANTAIRPWASLRTICRQCRFNLQQRPMSMEQGAASIHSKPALTNVSGQTADDNADAPPRWARTPQAMRAPFRTRPKNDNDDFPVNEDPKRLDAAYIRVLGNGGDKMLSESVKWLAVTHKSFDHGARGFNERLAFLGKRIIELQTSLALLSMPRDPRMPQPDAPDKFGRVPFKHQALDNVENLDANVKERMLAKRRLAQLAQEYGLEGVTRWKPKQINNLQYSGVDLVLAQTLCAIVGAVALQKGGEIANQIVRQRILQPLSIV